MCTVKLKMQACSGKMSAAVWQQQSDVAQHAAERLLRHAQSRHTGRELRPTNLRAAEAVAGLLGVDGRLEQNLGAIDVADTCRAMHGTLL